MASSKYSPAMLRWLALVGLAVSVCHGAYIITTPRQWRTNQPNQVCVFVPSEASPEGSLNIRLDTGFRSFSSNAGVIEEPVSTNVTIAIPAGRTHSCHDIDGPGERQSSGQLSLLGNVGGANISENRNIRYRTNYNLTFIQPDKFLYQPGQKVQFRVLTIHGPEAEVSTDQYDEIWVTTPSRTRIAQWKRVDNSAGLVHLSFQLADEPEEGSYTIHVKTTGSRTNTNRFKVEEYVLPRYEVKVTPPKYILATDESFTFNVCAKYTFGQPVKGNVTIKVSNNQGRRCHVKIERTEPITGCKDIDLTASELRVTDCNVYSVSVSATVEEEGTGVKIDANANQEVKRSAVTFRTVYEDNYKKPNLPFTLKVKASLPDGSPAAGVPVEVCAAGKCSNMTTAPDGLFTAVVSSDRTNRVFMSTLNCRADMYSTSYSSDLKHYFSPSNSSLLIRVPENKLKCDPGRTDSYNLPVFFASNRQPRAVVNVQLVSRGKIQSTLTQDVEFVSGTLPIETQHLVDSVATPTEGIIVGVIELPISIPPTASPDAKVLVWYTRDDGEVVSDTAEVEIEKCLQYGTNLTWSAAQGQPGSATTLTVVSEPNAICSVGVVDKSTELLSGRPDPITINEIFNYVNQYKIYPWVNSQVNDYTYCERKDFAERKAAAGIPADDLSVLPPRRFGNFYSDYVDALQMFDDSGLYVITDFTVETRPCEREEQQIFSHFGPSLESDIQFAPLPQAAPGPAAAFGGASGGGFAAGGGAAARPPPPSPVEEKETVAEEPEANSPRTEFPETWLWDIVTVPSTGISEQNLNLPDTITQWVGKAVCAHPQKGVGLSEKASITTFTPFFSDLTLPPSVKRGEVLPVKISVFNYLNEELPVTVVLGESPEYEVVEDPTSSVTGNQRQTCLAPQDKVVHTIKIRPLALGDVNLTVSAFVDTTIPGACGSGNQEAKRDTLIKPIKVEAEGFLREKTWTKYVCAEDLASGEDAFEPWQVAPPADIVPDSARGWVTAVGDLLALSLENLGSLIRMPYGCGEQNMINFAPNIFIMQYLTVTNQRTPESTEKLLRFMRTGYQRELLYRRSNGSFSAFGNADDSGSTWLTAFVLKSFAQAKEFISVDEDNQEQTQTWLSKSERDENGCFISVGKVFHKGMKGGLSGKGSPVPLTAYILTSLLESGTAPNSHAVTDATRCVLQDTSRDPYTVALKAYALALAKNNEAKVLVDQLLEMAVVEKNAIYWNVAQTSHGSNALAVETAGYAILAMMAQDPEFYSLKARDVVKWITTKRNGQGGFFSTQDTVVALQAMAAYETHTYQGPLNVVATVTAQDFSHSFSVTEDNKLLQQLQTLPAFPTDVNINMEGQGCAVMQGVLRYNIPEPEGSDAFFINVSAINDPSGGCTQKRIETCASYLLPDEKSNMAVIEVNLISGFIPEKSDLKSAVRLNRGVVKRYEVDGSKVSFYIEEFTAKPVCVSFRISRDVEVENIKPGTAVVYDYYQPEFSKNEKYSFPHIEGCTR